MSEEFRVIDTGIRDGREQIAFDQAMIDLHAAGKIPDSVRFLRFPPTALIGRHQALSQELKLDFCRDNNIRTVRRITGGGALYFDEGQLGWELIFHRSTLGISSLADLAREICEAAALGLSKLGVDAKYRPRNDIEVDGRKISGTGGFFDGDTLFYQGTVLVDMDAATMVAALNVPKAKLEKKNLDSAAQRIVTLKELLEQAPAIKEIQDALLDGFAERLGIKPERGDITQEEEELTKAIYDDEIGTDEFVAEIDDPTSEADVLSATHTGQGGSVTAHVRVEGAGQNRFREVLITGDFFVTPPRIVLDLEAALRGTAVGEVRSTVEDFFKTAEVGLLTITPDDFSTAIENAAS
ncbi:MAG: lipoate--protein ligase family protein [Rhizobiaceae bacterium]